MGFLSFHQKYYERRLAEYESEACSPQNIYEAKQLLKVLDDLADEGYPALGEYMEEKFRCVTRLKAFIQRAGELPFPIPGAHALIEYGDAQMPLEEFLKITPRAPEGSQVFDEALLFDIADYSGHIGREKDCAYIFLLRDCLLPYFCFAQGGADGLYAYPIGRAFLRDISGEANFDDRIRLPIYLGAEEADFDEFKEFFACETAKTLRAYPRVKDTLARLLGGIPYSKIVVVESGYCGTIPMLLSVIDGRVDFKMYTTAPFFFDVYKNRIFCKRYERLRSFETLLCQDALFEYSSFKDGKFFVRATKREEVLRGAAAEIAFVTARAGGGLSASKS